MTTVAAVRLDGVVKRFGDVRALDQLTVTVAAGQVYALLGPNGAGKTTAIRMMLDLMRPTSGTVRVLGLDPRRAAGLSRRSIGYVPGDFRVDERQSARDLLAYLAHLRGGVSRSRIIDLIDRFRLTPDVPISTLSRGNRQKVAIIQAFMHDAELLILDEPTSGLDPYMQQEFSALVGQTAAEGRTVLMSSHIMSEVQQNAHRVGILNHGHLVVDQDVSDLRDQAARSVEVVIAEGAAIPNLSAIDGVTGISVDGRTLRLRLSGPADPLIKALAHTTVVTLTAQEADLEDIFFAAERDASTHGGRDDQ